VVVERNGIQWAFYIYAIGMLLTLVVSQNLSFKNATERISLRHGLRSLLSNRHFLLFLGTVFIAGIGMATVNNFFFLYMKEAGAPPSLMGLALTISTLSEAPVLIFSNFFLRWLKPRGLLMLAMVIISLRLTLYALFPHPSVALIVQLLHGFTFPILWVAGVSFTQEVAPEGMVATAQGVFGSVMMGFGAGAGGLLGGLLIERLEIPRMYGVVGGIVLAGLLGFLLAEKWMLAHHK